MIVIGQTVKKGCNSIKLETYDDYIPTGTTGDHTQIIFPDDTSSDLISNISGVMTILKNTNIEMIAYFNFSKLLGGTDEVRVVLINSAIFDVTKIVRQAVFSSSANKTQTTLNFTDALSCSSTDHVGDVLTLWIVREEGTVAGLVHLEEGSTQAEPSASIEFLEIKGIIV